MTEKRMLAIGDMHTLGKCGLQTAEVVDPDENVYPLNPMRSAIKDKWDEMIDYVKSIGGVDMVYNGL